MDASLRLQDFNFFLIELTTLLFACLHDCIVGLQGETSYTGAISSQQLRRIFHGEETFSWGWRDFNSAE